MRYRNPIWSFISWQDVCWFFVLLFSLMILTYITVECLDSLIPNGTFTMNIIPRKSTVSMARLIVIDTNTRILPSVAHIWESNSVHKLIVLFKCVFLRLVESSLKRLFSHMNRIMFPQLGVESHKLYPRPFLHMRGTLSWRGHSLNNRPGVDRAKRRHLSLCLYRHDTSVSS